MKDYGKVYPDTPPGKGLILRVTSEGYGVPVPGEEILADGVQYTVCRVSWSKEIPSGLLLEVAPSGLLPKGDALDEMLSKLDELQEILSQDPEGAAILRKIQTGVLAPEQALRDLVRVVERTGQLGHLREVSREISAKIPRHELVIAPPESPRPLVMKTSTGIPQLNPLYEAALIERSFLDGDVPEARTGPLPEGAHPAVPVETSSLDPVCVGLMLEKASHQVAQQLADARAATLHLRDVALESGTSLVLIEKELPLPTGVPGYQAGTQPPLAEVAVGDEELASLTLDRRQELAHQALTTTQGRRSLAPPIQEAVLKILRERGLTVYSDALPDEKTSTRAVWSMNSWGSGDFSPNFQFGQIAARSLAENLYKQLPDPEGKNLYLEVRPYDGVSDRDFGWVALLSERRRSS